jgi:hypothetical protein
LERKVFKMTEATGKTPDAASVVRHVPPPLVQLGPPFPLSAVSVAIDPVALVTSECITVTSAMRKNARWAQSSVSAILGGGGGSGYDSGLNTPVPGSPAPLGRKGRAIAGDAEVGLAGRWGLRGKRGKSIQDNPLMAAFAKLRGDLQECKGLNAQFLFLRRRDNKLTEEHLQISRTMIFPACCIRFCKSSGLPRPAGLSLPWRSSQSQNFSLIILLTVPRRVYL